MVIFKCSSWDDLAVAFREQFANNVDFDFLVQELAKVVGEHKWVANKKNLVGLVSK